MDSIQKSLRLAELLRKQLTRSLSPEEAAELESLRREHPENAALMEGLTDPGVIEKGLTEIRGIDVDRGWERLASHMSGAQRRSSGTFPQVWRLAAVVTGLVLAGSLLLRLWTTSGRDTRPESPKSQTVEQITPGTDRAFLVLADGTEIPLDSAGNGDLALQGSTRIVKRGANLAYLSEGNPAEPVFNTIRTPRGGQYSIELSDGSRVWLNAASSLRFPATFPRDRRVVQLTGEAFFEVSPDPARRFIVEAGKVGIAVTGTRFNVNAYEDEDGILTTLAEGGVRVTSEGQTVELRPEQEVRAGPDGRLGRVKTADLETALAWKNGKFIFNAADVPSIMRQLGRWYDIEVSYAGPVSRETFTGMVSRQSDITRVLRILEAGGLRFKILDKRIVVE